MNLRSDRKEYKKAIYKFGYGFVYCIMRPWLRVPFVYPFSSISKEVKAAVEVLHSFSTGVINDRKKSLQETGQFSAGKKKKMALIDLLFKAKEGEGVDINDDGIREEIDTFMFEVRQTQMEVYQSNFKLITSQNSCPRTFFLVIMGYIIMYTILKIYHIIFEVKMSLYI